MCGIAGFWTAGPLHEDASAILKRMAEAVRHRGPDDEGAWLDADAGIGCWNAKFSFSFWRPVTAIAAGGDNPELTADPSWLPLGTTPSHPEYPAGHACVTGAVSTILARYFGSPKLAFSVDSLVTNTTHNFTGTNDLVKEVENARIYAGFHYHHSVIQGRVLGLKVGHNLMQGYFGPAR